MRSHLAVASKLVLAVASILVISPSVPATERNVVPDKMMSRIAWSLAEPVPASAEDLVRQLEAYAKSLKTKVNKRELQRLFPGKQLDIRYDYGMRRPGGHWETVHVVVRVQQCDKPVTFAEILFQLHRASHKHLKDDDHHFFEGLYLLDDSFEPGIPAYEVYLGS